MDRHALIDLVVRFTDAFNTNDLDGVMAFMAEDAVYDEFTGAVNRGKAAIRALRGSVDVILVSMHWGTEGASIPHTKQINLAHVHGELAALRAPYRSRHAYEVADVEALRDRVASLVGKYRAARDAVTRLQRADRERARRAAVQVFPHGVLEQRDVDHVLLLRDADARAEVAHRFRCEPAAANPGDGRHAGIVPAADELLLDQRQQPALAHHRVIQVEPGKLDLLRTRGRPGVFDDPVVQRAVILELQRADGVRDPFD